MPRQVPRLDPDSEKGREVAKRFSEVMAQIYAEIATRKAVAASQNEEVA